MVSRCVIKMSEEFAGTTNDGQELKKKRLLVIDDDPSMLKLLEHLFKTVVKEVLTASNGQEGLRQAMMYKPDLIFLDMNMPDMNGLELLEQLQEIPSMKQIPVIMLTADSSEKNVYKTLQNNVMAYLLKPCDPRRILETGLKYLGPEYNVPGA